jgi:hypothetical protein
MPRRIGRNGGGAGWGQRGAASVGPMLLSLNFILLSFFIVLNSLARAHGEKQTLALASLAQALDTAGPPSAVPAPPGPAAPHAGPSGWQPQLSTEVLGMVSNQLAVGTPELESDAGRLLAVLPVDAIFNGAALKPAAATTLPNLLALAEPAGAQAEIWLRGPDLAAPLQAQRLKALTALPGIAGFRAGVTVGEPAVVVTFRGPAGSAENLGRLPGAAAAAGGTVHGETDR